MNNELPHQVPKVLYGMPRRKGKKIEKLTKKTLV